GNCIQSCPRAARESPVKYVYLYMCLVEKAISRCQQTEGSTHIKAYMKSPEERGIEEIPHYHINHHHPNYSKNQLTGYLTCPFADGINDFADTG
ncbi:unnamed protein product, partial [marine sediment metagenome]